MTDAHVYWPDIEESLAEIYQHTFGCPPASLEYRRHPSLGLKAIVLDGWLWLWPTKQEDGKRNYWHTQVILPHAAFSRKHPCLRLLAGQPTTFPSITHAFVSLFLHVGHKRTHEGWDRYLNEHRISTNEDDDQPELFPAGQSN